MKKIITLTVILFSLFITDLTAQSVIRVNLLGYTEDAVKTAVLLSKEKQSFIQFHVVENASGDTVYTSENIKFFQNYGDFETAARLDISGVTKEGTYYVTVNDIESEPFRVSNDVYDGAADFVLKYMRQQRCGYNPFLKDSCHVHDGFVIYHPELDSTHINVIGGWHDASDYLQYLTTSANATFQMLFAYYKNPKEFGDKYDANGLEGANGIPDILDEAKWGLDWLDRMNPQYGMMFNQIADDRDHAGFRLPNKDSVDYGKGFERPVYFINGKPQGVFEYKNRTEGVSSSAAKYASAFTFGAELMKKYYPEFAEKIKEKGIKAYEFAKSDTGQCQTAPGRAPYFYEEDNWVDDMELAAAVLGRQHKGNYIEEAASWAQREPVTPWMGADTARHYQWYPFLNLGHYFLAESGNEILNKEAISYMRRGIEKVYNKGKENPFFMGIPFIWCSNNLNAAMLTQVQLYEELTGESKYAEMEASMRDWMFGVNPWGTSMIVGFPEGADTPVDPHSAFTHLYDYKIDGGLVDGPVYSTIYDNLKYLHLTEPDEYAEFQNTGLVYHDDVGDYSTNEPTMDGTASLTYYLSSLQKEAKSEKKKD